MYNDALVPTLASELDTVREGTTNAEHQRLHAQAAAQRFDP